MANLENPTSNSMGTTNSQENQDTSQSNANAAQSTHITNTEESRDTSQSNSNKKQGTFPSKTEESQDTPQSKANADQSASLTNTEEGEDTIKNQETSSSIQHLTKRAASTVINTSRTLLSSTRPLFNDLYHEVSKAVFRQEGFFALVAFLVGCEASRSKQAFCLVLFSFLGGSEYGQRVPFHTLLYFIAGYCVGVGAATVYIMLLLCLIAYACELNTRDAVLVGFSFLFGLLCNVSDQAFFLVVYSYLGGLVVRWDKEALIYLGLSFLMGSSGAFSLLAIPFSLRF